ncbi:MAG: N-acetylmuramoyl-L-alanine amidase [Calditrichaceae bacterium]
MIRRKFLNVVLSLSGSLLLIPNKILSAAGRPAQFDDMPGKKKLIINIAAKGINAKEIRVLYKWKEPYLSLPEFVASCDYGIYTNPAKRKSVVYIGNDKATFTADNTFVILNEQIYQNLYESIWKDSELWIPVQALSDLFSKYTSQHMEFDKENLRLNIGMKAVNISNIKISIKENGTLIRIMVQKRFAEKDITLDIRNGWLHADFLGGKVDTEMLSRQKAGGIVSSIQAIQFEQLASIAFKLKTDILSKELIFDQDSDDVWINIRTKENISHEKTEDLERQKNNWLIDTIIIDAGHGGKDPGAVGYGKLNEKEINLAVALKLGEIISKKNPSLKIVYTRKTDVFIPLWQRTKIANENKGKLFISLHCNSSKSQKASGFETYFLSADKNEKAKDVVLKENASIEFEESHDRQRYEGVNFILATMAQSAFIRQSQYLSSLVQTSLNRKLNPLGMVDRGVKQGPFWVMVGATMPNILIEMGYISNKYESKMLKNKSTQLKLAEAIYEGIAKYKNDVESSI